MDITDAQIKKAFNDFQKAHNHNIPVKLTIEEGHPDDSTQEAISSGARTYATYQQSKQQITAYRGNLQTDEQTLRVFRHELVGHYGIDTFAPIEKRILLDKIIQSREEADLKSTWERIERDYIGKSKYVQAEEVYAAIAEIIQDRILAKERSADLDPEQLIQDLNHKATITVLELRTITESVDNGIIAGLRQTQNIREHDGTAFSKNMALEIQETESEAGVKVNKTLIDVVLEERKRNNNQHNAEPTVFTDDQKQEMSDYAYANLAQNLAAVYASKHYKEDRIDDTEMADLAFYRGVMAKSSELKGIPVDYILYDMKASIFGVPHVEGLENHPDVKEAIENNKNKQEKDGQSL